MIHELRDYIEKVMGYYRITFMQFFDSYNGHMGFDNLHNDLGWTDSVPRDLFPYRFTTVDGAVKCSNEWATDCPGFFRLTDTTPCLFFNEGDAVSQCSCVATDSTIRGTDPEHPTPFLLKATYLTQIYDSLEFLVDYSKVGGLPLWTEVIPQWSLTGAQLPGATFAPVTALKVSHIVSPRLVVERLFQYGLSLMGTAVIKIAPTLVSYQTTTLDALTITLSTKLKDNGLVGTSVINVNALLTEARSVADFALRLNADLYDKASFTAENAISVVSTLIDVLGFVNSSAFSASAKLNRDLLNPASVAIALRNALLDHLAFVAESGVRVEKKLLDTVANTTDGLVGVSTVLKFPESLYATVDLAVLAKLLQDGHFSAASAITTSSILRDFAGLPADGRIRVLHKLLRVSLNQAVVQVVVGALMRMKVLSAPDIAVRLQATLKHLPEGYVEARAALTTLLRSIEVMEGASDTTVRSMLMSMSPLEFDSALTVSDTVNDLEAVIGASKLRLKTTLQENFPVVADIDVTFNNLLTKFDVVVDYALGIHSALNTLTPNELAIGIRLKAALDDMIVPEFTAVTEVLGTLTRYTIAEAAAVIRTKAKLTATPQTVVPPTNAVAVVVVLDNLEIGH
jgi:hypothetical protein